MSAAPTISLCMILRDEEKQLPTFLEHAKGAFDQFVAVDTGSVDGTVALLEAAGAEVHHFPWQDDFALARNESLSHATGDWILSLDADELPEPGFAKALRAVAADDRLGAANIICVGGQKNETQRISRLLRVFRNDTSIRYRHRIHEDPSASVQAMLEKTGRRLGEVPVPVRHIGYLPEHMQSRNKQERDERLLELTLKDDPKDLYSRYKLLELYRFWDDPKKARGVARDCRRLLDKGAVIRPPHIAGDFVEMIRAALFGDDLKKGLSFLKAMAPHAAHTGHYHVAMGGLLENLKDYAASGQHFAKALELAEGDPSRQLIETRALCGLTRLFLATGHLEQARTYANAAAQVAPDDPEVQLVLQFLPRIAPV